jgi:hypothetical protein
VQDGRAEWSYVEHGPLLSNFCRLPVAVVFLRCSSHTSFCLVRGSPAYVPPPDFAHLLTAADHGCGDAMTSGRTCPLVVFICLVMAYSPPLNYRLDLDVRTDAARRVLARKATVPRCPAVALVRRESVDRRYRSRLYPFPRPRCTPPQKTDFTLRAGGALRVSL